MTWVRIHQGAPRHPKIVDLSDGASRVWWHGLDYCQEHLTDGFIPKGAALRLHPRAKHFIQELTRPQVEAKAPLWSAVPGGYQVHDYLQWNDSRATVMEKRDWQRRRNDLYSDAALLASVRARDGGWCRYCGRPINWKDRRGPEGGTYDHVIARGPNTLENIVVACRGCNSSKGDRSLEQCGMRLRPAVNGSRVESSLNLASTQVETSNNLASTQVETSNNLAGTSTPTITTTKDQDQDLPPEGGSPPLPDELAEQAFADAWNAITTSPIPRCHALTLKRRARLRKCLEERPLETWRLVFQRVESSAFCRGVNPRQWVASFDWIIQSPDNAAKVLEGNYDDQTPTKRTPTKRAHWSDDCHHEPKCERLEWHRLKVAKEDDAQRESGGRRA